MVICNKMNCPKVSIIVPVYNAEIFLSQCLDSIIAQSFKDWECILIDDGSKDGSGRICDEYAIKDTRFRVFHKKNGGVSSARNLGIDHMKGEFVIFIDADDLLYPYSIQSLIEGIIDNSIGSSVGGFVIFNDENPDIFTLREQKKVKSTHDAIVDFYNTRNKDWQKYLWNRLFRSNFILEKNIRFREDIQFKEDGLFLIQYLTRINKDVYYTSDIVYRYRQNADSATASLNKGFNPKLLSNLLAHQCIVQSIATLNDKVLLGMAKDGMINSYEWVMSFINDKEQLHYYELKYKDLLMKTVGESYYYRFLRRRKINNIINLPIRIVRKLYRELLNKQ